MTKDQAERQGYIMSKEHIGKTINNEGCDPFTVAFLEFPSNVDCKYLGIFVKKTDELYQKGIIDAEIHQYVMDILSDV